MRRLLLLPLLLLLVLIVMAVIGCSGGNRTLNLGDNVTIQPPVGTEATSPDAAVFGPIAGFLPPAGTIINYRVSKMLHSGTDRFRVLFVDYNNTAGSLTLDVRKYESGVETGHHRYVFWVTTIDGQSYCWRRKKIFVDSGGIYQVTKFAPGVLLGLFSPTLTESTCTYTSEALGSIYATHTFTMRYKGVQSVSAAGTSYSCRVVELSRFMGDLTRIQIYFAPGVGPVSASLSPMVALSQTRSIALPKWMRVASINVESVTSEPAL